MRDIRLAAISINSPLGDIPGVLEGIDHWSQLATEQGAELLLFPELQIVGHCTPNTWELSESVPDGPSTQRVTEIARKYHCYISVGLGEKENDIGTCAEDISGKLVPFDPEALSEEEQQQQQEGRQEERQEGWLGASQPS